jgi:hypothetical protein
MVRDFDDNEFPLAYFISFRCYGTWVHGDQRGSMDRQHNVYGTSKIAPNSKLLRSDLKQLKQPPFSLGAEARPVVEKAVREVCDHRKYIPRTYSGHRYEKT